MIVRDCRCEVRLRQLVNINYIAKSIHLSSLHLQMYSLDAAAQL